MTKFEDKFTFGARDKFKERFQDGFQISFKKIDKTKRNKIPDKITFGNRSRQISSDFLKIYLFKLPRLLFKCPS